MWFVIVNAHTALWCKHCWDAHFREEGIRLHLNKLPRNSWLLHDKLVLQIHVHLIPESWFLPSCLNMVCWHQKGKREPIRTHSVADHSGKHSVESSSAVSLELICVPGVVHRASLDEEFTTWNTVYSCCCPPITWGMSTSILKSRIIGWEHNTENAGGLFTVQSARLKDSRWGTSSLPRESRRIRDRGNRELPEGQGCVPIKMTSRHLTRMTLS